VRGATDHPQETFSGIPRPTLEQPFRIARLRGVSANHPIAWIGLYHLGKLVRLAMSVSAVADSDRPSSQRPENDGRGSCGFYIVAVLVWEAVAILVSNQGSLAEGVYTALAVIPPVVVYVLVFVALPWIVKGFK